MNALHSLYPLPQTLEVRVLAVITITDDDPLGTIGFALDYYEAHEEFINGEAST